MKRQFSARGTDMASSPSPQPNVFASGSVFEHPLRFWAAILVTGCAAGLAGGALMLLLRGVQHLAWSYQTGDFLEGVERASTARRLLALTLAGALVGVGRLTFLRPTGGHSGELSEAIWFRAGRLPLVSTVFKGAFSIIVVALGASLGREGAPKQIGAAVASAIAQRAKFTAAQSRLIAACGAGAGMAAVYNVPFGGALFAIEVLLGSISLPLVFPALAASLLATATAWLLLPDQPTYAAPIFEVTLRDFFGAGLLGALIGLAASLFVALLSWVDGHQPKKRLLFAAPIIVFVGLGAASLPYPQLLGNGKDVVQLSLFNQMGPSLLLALLVLKPLATIACLGSGAPGGLFTPTMSVGAVAGAIVGLVWGHIWPGAPTGLYALLGAAAFLAAATKGPVSATVMTLELTGRVDSVMVLIMLAVTLATLVSRLIDARSIYSGRIHQGRAAAGAGALSKLAGFRGLTADDPTVTSAATPYYGLLKRLLARPNSSIYVVDAAGRLLGAVSTARALEADKTDAPLEAAAAADLVEPVPALLWPKEADAVARRLAELGVAEAPAIESAGGRLLGFVTNDPGA
jgi:chloride channel protein, CIC family